MKLKESRWLVVVPRVMRNRIALMFIETTVKDGTNAFACVRNEYRSRSSNINWIRSIAAQCKRAGVPVFVKQLGAKPVVNTEPGVPLLSLDLLDKKGGDIWEWPNDLG